MDSIKEIALAKVAKFLTNPMYVKVYGSNTVWQEILLLAGQKELYFKNSSYLTPYYYNGQYQNENYRFNQVYSVMYNIIDTIYDNGNGIGDLYLLIKEGLDKVNVINVIDYDKSVYSERDFESRIEFLKEDKHEYVKYIKNNLTKDFEEFIRCLNILCLDVEFDISRICTKALTQGVINRNINISSLEEWLDKNYKPCYKSYNDAINNFSIGQYGSCISDCRVTLTGLFSNFKETQEWFNGILQLNNENYKDEEIIKKVNDSSKILNDKIGGNFPRFKAIYKIYGMLCDLGPHRNEGKKTENGLNLEEVSMADALMSLRFTEDILIWAMNTINKNNNKS